MYPDENLSNVMRKALKLVKEAYELSTEPDVKDRLSYTGGLLEASFDLLSPAEVEVPQKKNLLNYLKGE